MSEITVAVYERIINLTIDGMAHAFAQAGIDASVTDEIKQLWHEKVNATTALMPIEPAMAAQDHLNLPLWIDPYRNGNGGADPLPQSSASSSTTVATAAAGAPRTPAPPTASLAAPLPVRQTQQTQPPVSHTPASTQQQQPQTAPVATPGGPLPSFDAATPAGATPAALPSFSDASLSYPHHHQHHHNGDSNRMFQPIPPDTPAVFANPLTYATPAPHVPGAYMDPATPFVPVASTPAHDGSAPSATAPEEAAASSAAAPAPAASDEAAPPAQEYKDDELLSDSDEEEAPEETGEKNMMLCTAEKVTRNRNRWKTTLRGGIVTIRGRDYVFRTATGEFTF
ncbi:hypothetical protein CAOG_09000 [Capsaspora owczarzaki ATCC 30864]|uniref:Uncharacterized protein n=1 Tax=Capsaspora owczarzaki (strain ATCC 30864) TaxID=595528 RepID=A0A0D2VXE3_CAPO3|nr:hypothetical protein CAOG_09000 [Capsaspora owczarzaki ATCC 30864]KJE96322.1 hypothetical protein CAOG_009000 [Capsaspora owczarzaki ATCC 30864]|eukprot:XP_011270687.1 hypothetical protein CAOG_09000 [Capsaspora owczarzaki ATCC 30864]